jgi:hypothetical protein
MSGSDEIDIQADYLSFRDDLIEKLGPAFAMQTDIFFERAVHEAQNGLFPSAIRDAQFALSTGVYQEDSYRLIYLIGFLCQVHLDNEDYQKARCYLDMGYKMLDKSDPDYADDKTKFDCLKDLIEGEDWKRSD